MKLDIYPREKRLPYDYACLMIMMAVAGVLNWDALVCAKCHNNQHLELWFMAWGMMSLGVLTVANRVRLYRPLKVLLAILILPLIACIFGVLYDWTHGHLKDDIETAFIILCAFIYMFKLYVTLPALIAVDIIVRLILLHKAKAIQQH